MSPRALVTGGSGFVGTHLIAGLLDKGWDVVSLDIKAPRADARPDVKSTWMETDLVGAGVLRDVVWSEVDVVFHLAAAPWNASRDDELVRVNTYGTLQALFIARALHAQFILASSGMVYGAALHTPFLDWDIPRPHAPYGYSKWMAEELTRHFATHYGVNAAILRCSNIYGPGQESAPQIIPDLLRKLITDAEPLQVRGTGKETRDFVYIDDAIAAYLLLARDVGPGCLTYNMGTGVPTRTSEVAETLLEAVSEWRVRRGWATSSPVFTGKQGPHDPEQQPIALDAARLRARGWNPTVNVLDGLRRTAAVFQALQPALRKTS